MTNESQLPMALRNALDQVQGPEILARIKAATAEEAREAPPVSEELLEYLDAKYPLEILDLDATLSAFQRQCGQRDIIESVRYVYNLQNSNEGL